ncbi:MAG: class IIb bacteriocin, lactobin A/cerein 7B family [Erysipelotrichaceae bacterium]
MKSEYETPRFVPLTDLELEDINGGGIPVVNFILIAAITVVAAAFLVAAGAGWTFIVGPPKMK